jgi:predicted Zn-dependent protease
MNPIKALVEAWERRKILRSLKSFESNDKEERYWSFRFQMVEALELCERDHFERAKSMWDQAKARFPEQPLISDIAIKLLLRLQLYEEAEFILRSGEKKFPNDPRFFEGLVLASYAQAKYTDALNLCRRSQKRFPKSVIGYSIAGASLSQLGRAGEAEEELTKAFRQVPDDAGLLIEHAKFAERREDWATALERWNKVYEIHKHAAGVSGAATALAKLGRFDEADKLIEEVRYRFGNEPVIWFTHANVAVLRNDMQSACNRWEFVQTRFPRSPIGYLESYKLLRILNRDDEAEAAISRGLDSLPEDAQLLITFARAAHHRRAWSDAAIRWSKVRKHLPQNREGYLEGAIALETLGAHEQASELRAMCPNNP